MHGGGVHLPPPLLLRDEGEDSPLRKVAVEHYLGSDDDLLVTLGILTRFKVANTNAALLPSYLPIVRAGLLVGTRILAD